MFTYCNDIINTKLFEKEGIMAKTAVIQTRVDPVIKQHAQAILKKTEYFNVRGYFNVSFTNNPSQWDSF